MTYIPVVGIFLTYQDRVLIVESIKKTTYA